MNYLLSVVWFGASAHPPKVPSPISRSAFQTFPFLLLPGGRLLTAAPAARFFDVELACMKPHFDVELALAAFGGAAVAGAAGSAGAVAPGSGGACYCAIG